MYELLNKQPLHFPSRHDPSTTLQHFLNNVTTKSDQKTRLPTIVRVTSLNNYGRSLKGLLMKNTSLLLISVDQLDSILAEYHGIPDHRHNSHRHRLTNNQSKMSSKATNKFRNMKKLSRSLVSLSANPLTDMPQDDDDDLMEGNDSIDAHQRYLVKSLNEKRSSSSIPLCRVPVRYRAFFELLDENDKPIEPYHKLADLMIVEYDDNDSEKFIERWPHAFLLRSPCSAYTKKSGTDYLNPISAGHEIRFDDQSSATSSDSCYGSTPDLALQKNVILLNDEPYLLPTGEILTILNDCNGLRTRISDKSSPEYQPCSSSSSAGTSSPSSLPWSKGRSFLSFFKKSRPSQVFGTSPTDYPIHRSTPGKVETYLKCRTDQGDIVYLSLHEPGLFSPLNGQTHRLKLDNKANELNLSGLFELKDLLSNFRFPISIRYLDAHVSFENIYAPAVINHLDSTGSIPTKFRLLMPYHERVVFACPLHLIPNKSQKNSPNITIIPLSINADILIQPCLNMEEISTNEIFQRFVQSCTLIIEQYQTEISLIHSPLQLTHYPIRTKQPLYKKRSQSESHLGYLDDDCRTALRYSDEQINISRYQSNASPLRHITASPNQATIGVTKQKVGSAELTRSHYRSARASYFGKQHDSRRTYLSQSDSEDEMYHDVDKIYDFIRSGNVTNEVRKIQDKELAIHQAKNIDIPSSHVNHPLSSSLSLNSIEYLTFRVLIDIPILLFIVQER